MDRAPGLGKKSDAVGSGSDAHGRDVPGLCLGTPSRFSPGSSLNETRQSRDFSGEAPGRLARLFRGECWLMKPCGSAY
jgi:hypothetical protein